MVAIRSLPSAMGCCCQAPSLCTGTRSRYGVACGRTVNRRYGTRSLSLCRDSVSPFGVNYRRCRCSIWKQMRCSAFVFTATRVAENSGVLQILGPGGGTPEGFGKLLSAYEFFGQPIDVHNNALGGPFLQGSLVYYFKGETLDSLEENISISDQRHGIHVIFRASMPALVYQNSTVICFEEENERKTPSMISHVKEATSLQTVYLASENGRGGARVQVVAGKFAGLAVEMPLHDFVFLDVFMRPSSQAEFPLDDAGVIVYILEGVGLFKCEHINSVSKVFYENEGHGIWFPPKNGDHRFINTLYVSTHPCSTLRFILLGSTL